MYLKINIDIKSLFIGILCPLWDWAGKFRKVELSIGIKAYLVPTTLKDLVDDIAFWNDNKHLIYMKQLQEYIIELYRYTHFKMVTVDGAEC